jgi:ribosome-associated protein
MILIEDTRNQIGKHKILNDEFNKLGVAVVRNKLYVGDYSRMDNMTTCIDTKKDWLELAGNICGKQHERFRNECLRARDAQIRLIILVEEEIPIEEWKPPRKRNGGLISHTSNIVLSKAMKTMTEKYGVEFIHCGKDKTAEIILKILGGQVWES